MRGKIAAHLVVRVEVKEADMGDIQSEREYVAEQYIRLKDRTKLEETLNQKGLT